MAGLNFNVNVKIRDNLSPMAERVRDLSPAFEEIVNAWTYGNLGKFEEASGAEMSGVQFSSVYWQDLTEDYRKQKRRKGYPDWLMKRTGTLMDAMTDAAAMQADADIGPDTVSFGFPSSLDEPMKIYGNWIRRQVIFLSSDDMEIIRQTIKDYLSQSGRFAASASPAESETSAEGGFDF